MEARTRFSPASPRGSITPDQMAGSGPKRLVQRGVSCTNQTGRKRPQTHPGKRGGNGRRKRQVSLRDGVGGRSRTSRGAVSRPRVSVMRSSCRPRVCSVERCAKPGPTPAPACPRTLRVTFSSMLTSIFWTVGHRLAASHARTATLRPFRNHLVKQSKRFYREP